MRKKQFTEIDQQTKEELLNLVSPDTSKGGIEVDKDKKPLPVQQEVGTIELSDEELANPAEEDVKSPVLNTPYSLDPNADSEIPDNFTQEQIQERKLKPYQANRSSIDSYDIKRMSSDKAGKGMEDYRKYIDNPLHNVNLDYTRAVSQKGWEQAGNGVVRFIANVIPEIIQQGAGVVEVLFNVLDTDEQSYGNSIGSSMEYLKSITNENFNIYLENPGASMSVGDSGWWADRLSNLATSATAFVALGYATGGIGAGTKIANMFARAGTPGKAIASFLKNDIAKGSKMSEVLKKISLGKTEGSIASIGDGLFNTYLMTSAESIGVATEVYHSVKEKEFQALITAGYSEEQAKKEANSRAMKAGDRAYMFNQWNMTFNVSSVLPFTRGIKAGQLPKKTLFGGAKRIAFEGVQESGEELVNLISEKRATDMDYSFKKAMEDTATREGAEAAFLGFLGGFAQTGLTLTGQYFDGSAAKYKETYAIQEEQRANIENLKSGDILNEWDLYKTTEEQTKIHNNIEGLSKKYKKVQTDEEREEIAKELDKVQSKLFYTKVYNSLQHGMGQEFIDKLESFKNLTDEEAAKLNFDVSEEHNYREVLDQRIKNIKELETIYNYTKGFYEGDKAYNYMSTSYYFKGLAENYKEDSKELNEAYLEELKERVEQEGFTFTEIDTNKEELTLKKEGVEELVEEGKSKIKSFKENIRKQEVNLLKAKARLTSLNRGENVSENQKKAIEKEIENIEFTLEENKKEILQEENTLNSTVAVSDVETERYNTVQAEVNENHKKRSALMNNYVHAETQARLNEQAADEVISLKGQESRRKRYIKSRKAIDKQLAEEEAKAKAKAREEKNKRNQAKNQAKTQSQKTSQPDSTTKNKETTTNTEEEIVTEETANFTFSNLSSKDVDVNNIAEELNFTEEELQDNGQDVITSMYEILSKTDSLEERQNLILGKLHKEFIDNETTGHQKLLDLYNDINEELGEVPNSMEDIASISSNTDFLEAYIAFEENRGTQERFDNIDEFDFNSENLENEDDETASEKVEEELRTNEGKIEFQEFGDWVDKVLESVGLTTDDTMDKIVSALINKAGENITRKVFYKIQGYVQYKSGKQSNQKFNSIYKRINPTAAKEAEYKKEADKKYIQDIPTLTTLEKDNKERATIAVLEGEGTLLTPNSKFSDNYNKATSIYDRLAYKVKETIKVTDSQGNVIFLGNGKLTDVDNRMLIKNGIKVGDKINFKVDTNFTNNKGFKFLTIFDEETGYTTTVTDPNTGIVTDVNSLLYAPIQVFIGDSALRDVYIHIPDFINTEHLPYDEQKEKEYNELKKEGVSIEEIALMEKIPSITKEGMQQQLNNLLETREHILNNENTTATIRDIGSGYFIDTAQDILINTLPNVSIGIYDGSSIIINGKKIKNVISSDKLKVGRTYALIPSGNEFFPYGIHKNKLEEEHINIVEEIIRLKLINKNNTTEEDKKRIEYYKRNGVDLSDNSFTSHKQFNDLLRKFVHINIEDGDFNFDKEIERYSVPTFFIKYVKGKTIIQGGTSKISFNSENILSTKSLLNSSKELKEILKQTSINVREDLLGKNVFIPSINKGGEIRTSYDTFIKTQLTSQIKSIKVDGEYVYEVQKSVSFDIDKIKEGEENLKKSFNITEAAKEVNTKAKEKAKEKLDKNLEDSKEINLDGLGDMDLDSDSFMYDNLEDFGGTAVNDMQNTLETLNKEGEIINNNKDGKPCK